MTTYPTVRLIEDDTGVNSSITNRPIMDLIQRTDYLKDQVDSLSIFSQRIILSGKPCTDSCIDSSLVYFDEDTGKWDVAYGDLVPIGTPSQFVAKKNTYVQGLVKNLSGSLGNRIGDVYIFGLIENINYTNMLDPADPTVHIGQPLFLTNDTATQGRATYIRQDIDIFIGKFVDSNTLILGIDYKNFETGHQHDWFDLEYANFIDLGGGEYLYPATAFPRFPPRPLTSSYVAVNGVGYYYGIDFTIDSDGLHYINSLYPPDPDPDLFRARFYYQIPVGDTNETVTQLAPATDNLIITSCETSQPATTGNLQIACIPVIDDISLGVSGSLVVKNIVSNENTGNIEIYKGQVVESINAGDGIVIDNSQGTVTISADTSTVIEKEITDIILVNAKEKIISGSAISYIEFPKGLETAIFFKTILANTIPRSLTIYIQYFGDKTETNTVKLYSRYKISKLDSQLKGTYTIVQKEILITTSFLHQSIELCTISGELLEKNCLIGFELRRDPADNYSGNFGILFIGQR